MRGASRCRAALIPAEPRTAPADPWDSSADAVWGDNGCQDHRPTPITDENRTEAPRAASLTVSDLHGHVGSHINTLSRSARAGCALSSLDTGQESVASHSS